MLTIKEARERVARLRTGALPWHIKLEVLDRNIGDLPPIGFEQDSGFEIAISWSVIDVDTGVARTFTLHLPVRPGEDVLAAARRAIRVIALHEIDEQLTVDGVRPWDPHLIDNGGNRRPVLKSVEDHAGCGMEFRHTDEGVVECDGHGWATPVDQAPDARGPRDSSDP